MVFVEAKHWLLVRTASFIDLCIKVLPWLHLMNSASLATQTFFCSYKRQNLCSSLWNALKSCRNLLLFFKLFVLVLCLIRHASRQGHADRSEGRKGGSGSFLWCKWIVLSLSRWRGRTSSKCCVFPSQNRTTFKSDEWESSQAKS